MCLDEIINNAKYVIFPQNFTTKYATNGVDYTKDIINEKILLEDNDSSSNRYFYYEGNQHHFTTKFSFETVVPKINSLINFGFNKDDFVRIDNTKIIKCFDGKDRLYDFSYYLPLKNTIYDCTFFNCDSNHLEHTTLNSNEIVNCSNICNSNEYKRHFGVPTYYHKLFKFPHQSCIIKNNNGGNGKTLLLNCDSQMIPSIPILCYYYSNVIVLDSRFGISTKLLYENTNIDDILFQVWIGHPMSDYIKNLV